MHFAGCGADLTRLRAVRADDHDEIVRLYGPWHHRTPADAAQLLADYPGHWWIAGGWAIEAFTGSARSHGDLDISVPRADVPLLRRHLAGRLDVWAAESGTLRPLLGDLEEVLPMTCGNLWLRPSGAEPWEYDVILTPVTGGTWTYKRDDRISGPLEQTLWCGDGLAYLRPEVQLLHKAPGLRAKDQQDFDASLPLLEPTARTWLRDALDLAHPGHPWSARL